MWSLPIIGRVHRTTKQSLFEVVYGFNPLTPLDLISLPLVMQSYPTRALDKNSKKIGLEMQEKLPRFS